MQSWKPPVSRRGSSWNKPMPGQKRPKPPAAEPKLPLPPCTVTYATQKIIRQSNVTERSLVTTCRLLNASRSDDNPNGFTIEGFTIIENKDLQTIKR